MPKSVTCCGVISALLTFTLVVALADDKRPAAIHTVAPLLADPIPEVQVWAQHALLCIGDSNPEKRTQILKLLAARKWQPSRYQSKDRDWVPTGR